MAELTTEGLVIRRYPEIRELITTAISQNANAELVFDEDVVLGQIVSILATQQTQTEQVLQAIYSSLDRDKAEGTSLDNLLALIGLNRINAAKSSTDRMLFKVGDNETISKGYIIENPSTKDRFFTTTTRLINVESCYTAEYEVTSLPASTEVVFSVNSKEYSYTTTTSPTELEIVEGLRDVIELDTSALWTATVYEPTPEEGGLPTLIITSDKEYEEISVSVLDVLEPLTVSAFLTAEAEFVGAIKAPANTITSPITPQTVISVTNTKAVGVGRERETDEEARVRASKSLSVSGSSTYAAMLAAMLNLPEVSNVIIEENETNTVDGNGLPPHSFSVILSAPNNTEVDQLIAKTIWEEKPLGIQTHGTTTIPYVDETGTTRNIKFSRPSKVIVAVRVTYTLYEEETPSDNIEEVIQNAVVSYGNSLTSGVDVIPKRFYESIYNSTRGIEDVTVEMQQLGATGDVPDSGLWSESRIDVVSTETSSFTPSDIYFVAGM